MSTTSAERSYFFEAAMDVPSQLVKNAVAFAEQLIAPRRLPVLYGKDLRQNGCPQRAEMKTAKTIGISLHSACGQKPTSLILIIRLSKPSIPGIAGRSQSCLHYSLML